MPVEFVNKKKGPKRLRFTRNTSYNGCDYGPDYPVQECDVDPAAAFRFINQGRAVEVSSSLPASETPGGGQQVQTRDPEPINRDPVIAGSASVSGAVATGSPQDLHKMTKAELLAYAHERNIGVTEHLKKAEILETIEAELEGK